MSRRSDKARRNRLPFWEDRATRAHGDVTHAVALQYDWARTHITKLPLHGARDGQWAALAAVFETFNTQFLGPDPTAAAGRRTRSIERRFKAATTAVDRAAAAFDLARFYLARMKDSSEQEQQWLALHAALRAFNERFTRDRTREIPA